MMFMLHCTPRLVTSPSWSRELVLVIDYCYMSIKSVSFQVISSESDLQFKHSNITPHNQLDILQTSISAMITDLDTVKTRSVNHLGTDHIEATHTVYTGRRGRPRIEIDEDTLEESYRHRGATGLGQLFNLSSRTVRRRVLEAGLAEAGEPVYVAFEDVDGNSWQFYSGSNRNSSHSMLSDEELDGVMIQILNSFPAFGRRMIDGHLKFLGYHIPRSRLQASYARVHGPPVSAFGVRRIQRRIYNVPGYNSLCHHDGQHGTMISIYHQFIHSNLQCNRLNPLENCNPWVY